MVERWGRLFWRVAGGMWLGTVFFLFFAIAPNVFRVLPSREADKLVQVLFPSYYAFGLVFGALFLLGAVLMANSMTPRRRWTFIGVGVLNWLLAVWGERTLTAMTVLAANSEAFKALHQRSIVISVGSFLVTLAGLAWESLGRPAVDGRG